MIITKSLYYEYFYHDLNFEWDENKNAQNIKKHGIDFRNAVSVFLDENARLIADTEHSNAEERFLILGLNKEANLLVVCHCLRASDSIIRIISARKATKNEENTYHGFLMR